MTGPRSFESIELPLSVTPEACRAFYTYLELVFASNPVPVDEDGAAPDYENWRRRALLCLSPDASPLSPRKAVWWVLGSGVPDDEVYNTYLMIFT